jgi:hypothetical protein
VQKLIARWNPARDAWETEMTGLFCEHSDVYSETWPTSGMTHAGTAYELPTSAPRTDGSACSSLLPTPDASMGNGGRMRSQEAIDSRAHQIDLNCLPRLLPTPRTSDTNGIGEHGTGGQDLRTVVSLLPTPTTTQRGTEANLDTRPGARANLHNTVQLLPTPRASDGPDASSHARSWSTTDRNLHTLVKNGELTSPPSDAGNPSSVA